MSKVVKAEMGVLTAQQVVDFIEDYTDLDEERPAGLSVVVCLGPGRVVYPVSMYIEETGPDLVLDVREDPDKED